MEAFLPLFFVLFASVFFSIFFTRLHLPWVVALILSGMIIGPYGIGVFVPDETIFFIGQMGLIFLMFMAGLETQFSTFREIGKPVFVLAFLNGVLPFVLGFGIALAFDLSLLAAILLGIVFLASSIAVVVPTLEAHGFLHSYLGKSIVAAVIVQDVVSIILLSLIIQLAGPESAGILPLWLFYPLLLGALFFMRWALPKTRRILQKSARDSEALFQQELRSIFLILIGTVVIFELLGLHPIIAGFFAGMVLSGTIESDSLKEKLKSIAYGIFIPAFFVVLGAQTDISVLSHGGSEALLAGVVIFGYIVSKFGSGILAARLSNFTKTESFVIGAATTPQLSTILAVLVVGAEIGALTEPLITALVALLIVSVFVSPIFVRLFSSRLIPEQPPAT